MCKYRICLKGEVVLVSSSGTVTHGEDFESKLKLSYNTSNIAFDRLQELMPGGHSRRLHVLDVKHTALQPASILTEEFVHCYSMQSVSNQAKPLRG